MSFVCELNMSTSGDFDCIVIGAGVQGSFTAYQLAKKNKKTLLLEQVRHEPSHFNQVSLCSTVTVLHYSLLIIDYNVIECIENVTKEESMKE